jgi:hypothetical protein
MTEVNLINEFLVIERKVIRLKQQFLFALQTVNRITHRCFDGLKSNRD